MSNQNEKNIAMLTDQIKSVYILWKNNQHNNIAVFDVFFRENPFNGNFAISAGVEDVLSFVENFKLRKDDIGIIRKNENYEDGFLKWLQKIDCSNIEITAIDDGTVVFPKIPLIQIKGPLAICKLLGVALKTFVKYPIFIATNATRFRLAAGDDKKIFEFGIRRANNYDNAVVASAFAYIGGIDASSNYLCGENVPIVNLCDHEFILLYKNLDGLKDKTLLDTKRQRKDFVDVVCKYRTQLGYSSTNEGELAAFIATAQACPQNFIALVDTCDTLKSGVPNFICVAMALNEFGYSGYSIHIDEDADLAFLSKKVRKMVNDIRIQYGINNFDKIKIIASNDISEEKIRAFNEKGHEIDVFAVASHIVDTRYHPHWECFYKIVKINETYDIAPSKNPLKNPFCGEKNIYRFYDSKDVPILDMLCEKNEKAPKTGERILCIDYFNPENNLHIIPGKIEKLSKTIWKGKKAVKNISIKDKRKNVARQLKDFEKYLYGDVEYRVFISEKLKKLEDYVNDNRFKIGRYLED